MELLGWLILLRHCHLLSVRCRPTFRAAQRVWQEQEGDLWRQAIEAWGTGLIVAQSKIQSSFWFQASFIVGHIDIFEGSMKYWLKHLLVSTSLWVVWCLLIPDLNHLVIESIQICLPFLASESVLTWYFSICLHVTACT